MKGPVLLATILSGLCVFSSCLPNQYHLVDIPMNWTNAQRYCREQHTDLVTVNTMEDKKKLGEFIASHPIKRYPVWSGLYATGSWSWSLADGQKDQLGPADFRNWKTGHPNKTGAADLCASIDSLTGRWEDQLCKNTLKFICQGETFEYIPEAKSWWEAQSYCMKQHTHLAHLRTLNDSQKIRAMLPSHTAAWIGLVKDPWLWSDGSDCSSFRFWFGNQPNENGQLDHCMAGVIYQELSFNDWKGFRELPFLCYSVPVKKHVVRMRLTSENSAVDLQDPAVMEDILPLLQLQLRQKGLPADFKLSWRKQPDGKIFHKEEEDV